VRILVTWIGALLVCAFLVALLVDLRLRARRLDAANRVRTSEPPAAGCLCAPVCDCDRCECWARK
jgi:hypothetical protein